MRKQLAKLEGQRLRFEGVVERFGTKRGWQGDTLPTLMLKNIRLVDDPYRILTDHLWMNVGKQLEGVIIGEVVDFDARVTRYEKGYKGRRDNDFFNDHEPSFDYRLERPTKVRFKSQT